MSSPLLEGALACARAGWPVFPCGKPHPSDDPGNHKAPWTPNGFKDATTDEETIRRWWAWKPEALVGLAPPEGSFVIDFDDDDGPAAFPAATGLDLPPTVVTKSPRGWHYWYLGDVDHNRDGRLQEATGLKINIRGGDNGYVVGPPSVREDGGEYFWWGPGLADQQPAQAPEDLVSFLNVTMGTLTFSPQRDEEDCHWPIEERIQEAEGWILNAAPVAKEGVNGNNRFFSASCALVRDFWLENHPDEMRRLLRLYNQHRCQPPWDDETKAVEHFLRRGLEAAKGTYGTKLSGKRMWARIFRRQESVPEDISAEEAAALPKSLAEEYIAKETRGLNKTEAKKFRQEFEQLRLEHDREVRESQGEFAVRPGLGDHAALADEVIRAIEHHTGQPPLHDSGLLWTYDEDRGLWREILDSTITKMVKAWSGEIQDNGQLLPVYKATVDGTVKIVKDLAATETRDPVLDQTPGLVFLNCFLRVDLEALNIVPVAKSPEHYATVGYDFDFDPDAEAPLFHAYLDSVWEGAPDKDERKALLQEFIGAALFTLAPDYHRAMILYGEAGTGKSTLTKILEALFPDGSVTQIQPQKFDDKDHIGLLRTSRLNSVQELSSETLGRIDMVKSVIDGATIPVSPKYERAFRLTPRAAHIFAANDLPQVARVDPSLWDRFMILPFNRRFRGTKEENVTLAREITSKERAGVAAWAVEGACRLLRQHQYTLPASHTQAMQEWKAAADSVALFLDHGCNVLQPEVPGLSPSTLFALYSSWCDRNGYYSVNIGTFGRRMTHIDGVKRLKVDNVRYYNVITKPQTATSSPPTAQN